jgi:hypothetical protein
MNRVCAWAFAFVAIAISGGSAAAAPVTFVPGSAAIPPGAFLQDFEAMPFGETGLVYADVPGTLPVRLSGHEIGDTWIPTPFTIAGDGANRYVSLAVSTALFIEFTLPLTYFGVSGANGANVAADYEFYTDHGLVPVAEFSAAQTSSAFANFFAAPGTTFDYVRIVAWNPATFDNLRFSTVPLPAAGWLFAMAALGFGGLGLRRRAGQP